MATSDSHGRSAADVQAAMEQVLTAERSAVDAIAASRRRAEELLQGARGRARRITERAQARIAALERASAAGQSDFGPAASPLGDDQQPSAEERAHLDTALELLADQLLEGDDAGP